MACKNSLGTFIQKRFCHKKVLSSPNYCSFYTFYNMYCEYFVKIHCGNIKKKQFFKFQGPSSCLLIKIKFSIQIS